MVAFTFTVDGGALHDANQRPAARALRALETEGIITILAFRIVVLTPEEAVGVLPLEGLSQ